MDFSRRNLLALLGASVASAATLHAQNVVALIPEPPAKPLIPSRPTYADITRLSTPPGPTVDLQAFYVDATIIYRGEAHNLGGVTRFTAEKIIDSISVHMFPGGPLHHFRGMERYEAKIQSNNIATYGRLQEIMRGMMQPRRDFTQPELPSLSVTTVMGDRKFRFDCHQANLTEANAMFGLDGMEGHRDAIDAKFIMYDPFVVTELI